MKIYKTQAVINIPKISKLKNAICGPFLHGKKTRIDFKAKECSSSNPLEMIHENLCGPTRPPTLQGKKYFILFIYDYTRMMWVFFKIFKLEALECFRNLKETIENESDSKIKCLRKNKGGEFNSREFNRFCE